MKKTVASIFLVIAMILPMLTTAFERHAVDRVSSINGYFN